MGDGNGEWGSVRPSTCRAGEMTLWKRHLLGKPGPEFDHHPLPPEPMIEGKNQLPRDVL